ncbi:MAG: WHG domain-containing protein [Bauldia sp.]|nr:WHG domain-containing protein [Bauldia sp.]
MPRVGLTAESVIDAATALADEQGMDAVTLAALAERLGVKPPSLYKHVAGLDAIQRGVALKGLREVNARIIHATVGLSQEDALVALAKAYWRFSREHPGLYAATLRATQPGDQEIEAAGGMFVGVVSAVLEGFGITGSDALHAVRAVRAIVHGFVSLDANGAFGTGANIEDSFVRLIRTFAAGLSPAGAMPPAETRSLLRIGRFSLRAG